MPALRFVAAQIMKMPIRYANAVHIPRAPDGDHIAAGVFKAKFVPAFRRLRKHRVGLPAAVPALRMHSLENAAGLDHIKEIGISLHKRRKHLLERGKIIDAVQRYLRGVLSNTMAAANAMLSSGLITVTSPSGAVL